MYTKFDDSRFRRSGDTIAGVENYFKVDRMNLDTPLLGVICLIHEMRCKMQSVQRLHSTNSDQRRDNLAE